MLGKSCLGCFMFLVIMFLGCLFLGFITKIVFALSVGVFILTAYIIGIILITACIVSTIYTEWVNNRVFQYYTLKITLKDNTEKVIEYVKASELSIRFAEDSTIIVCDTIPSVVKIELIEVKQKRYGEVHKNANF